jgi:hypothetical protein
MSNFDENRYYEEDTENIAPNIQTNHIGERDFKYWKIANK